MRERTLYSVIIKPTRLCNANCSYCSSTPIDRTVMTGEAFERIVDQLAPNAIDTLTMIWHGGEPMLLGPDFYLRAYDYARRKIPSVRFGIQTNLLLYDSQRWKTVFNTVFAHRVSTSFEPDGAHRLLKGSGQAYATRFLRKLRAVMEDRVQPVVISTLSSDTLHHADTMYDMSLTFPAGRFGLRLNYVYRAGRNLHGSEPGAREYGETLVRLYDRWIREMPGFGLVPLNQMVRRVIGAEKSRCPWSKACSGRILGVEPNGDVYNCSSFADLNDQQYRFGNIFSHAFEELMCSPAAVLAHRRRVSLPRDCLECAHLAECEGGCMCRVVGDGGAIGDRYPMCEAWKMVFSRIKQSIRSGECDELVRFYEINPDDVRVGMAA